MWLRSAYLIEGVRLERELHLAPVTLRAVDRDHGYVGRDGHVVFNAALYDAGFVTRIEPWTWGPQFGARRPLVLAVIEPRESAYASVAATGIVHRVVDLLALTHGGAPRPLAGVGETSSDAQHWRTLFIMAGSGPGPGSVLERISEEARTHAPLDIEDLWPRVGRDRRTVLWLSLHRGIAAEPRWDVRMFRLCALLETIARELVSPPVALLDRGGQTLLGHDGQVAALGTARGMIYLLTRRALDALSLADSTLCAHPSRSLWEEVGVWVDVRNAVAHEGQWLPPPLPSDKPARQRRTANAFQIAARGDGMDSGWMRYVDTCAAAAEVVLRAVGAGASRDDVDHATASGA